MSNKEKNTLVRSMPDRTSEYEVGYAKPPRQTRFKPGHSGNPRGRPKGSKRKPPALNEERLKDIILEEAYRTIKVNDGDKQVSVPMAQAVVRSMAVNAAKGNTRAQRLFSEMLAATETSRMKLHNEWLETAIEYKVNWERELQYRETHGTSGPAPLPHPDHVVVDVRNGTVKITGPMTPEEQTEWDFWIDRKTAIQDEINELRQLIDDPEQAEIHDACREDINHSEKILDIIENALSGKG